MKFVINRRRCWVLDNKGETLDRYTIIFGNGDTYGASENPFHPQGFGQYSHNIANTYMIATFCSGWRKRCRVRACTNEALRHYFSDYSNIGEMVQYDTLPEDVKKYIQLIAKN